MIIKTYEIDGEHRAPEDFIEAIYRTLLAKKKKIQLVAQRVDVDELTARRGQANTQIEFDFEIVYIDHTSSEVSVSGNMYSDDGQTKQWVLIQTNTEKSYVRFDVYV